MFWSWILGVLHLSIHLEFDSFLIWRSFENYVLHRAGNIIENACKNFIVISLFLFRDSYVAYSHELRMCFENDIKK